MVATVTWSGGVVCQSKLMSSSPPLGHGPWRAIVPLFPLVSMDRTVPSPNINTSYTSVHCVEASRARRLNETDARHGSSVELERLNYSFFFFLAIKALNYSMQCK